MCARVTARSRFRGPALACLIVLASACGGSIATDEVVGGSSSTTTEEVVGPSSSTTSEPEDDRDAGGEAVAGLIDAELSSATTRCIGSAVLDDPALLEEMVAAGPLADVETIPPDLLDRAMRIGLECATPGEIADAFYDGIGDDTLLPETAVDVSSCMGWALTDGEDDRVDAMVGLIVLDRNLRPDETSTTAVVDLLVECAGSDVLRDVITSEAIDDPALGPALDQQCLELETESPEFVRSFWSVTIDNVEIQEFDDIPDADKLVIIGPVWACISFGEVTAAAARQRGIAVDQATIDCIDASIDKDELLDAALAGRPPAGVDAAVAGCL